MSFKQRVIVWIVRNIAWFLLKSVRWEFKGSGLHPETFHCVVSCWHNRLLMTPLLFQGWRGPLIISDHSDGEMIAALFERFGLIASRGSSSKGGARALLKVIRMAKDGYSPGVTPDGPRGPIYEVKPGAAQIAIKSGLPILPICFATNKNWRLSSWDKFYVPKPFSRGVVITGEPIIAESGETTELFTARVQQHMTKNQQLADSYFTEDT